MHVTQSLKLRKSSKETACCRDLPSRSFRTPRNEDSQNMKPLSTSDSPETILSTFESLRNFTLPVFKLRNTHHPFTEVLAFLRRSFSGSTRLSLLHSASTASPSLIAIDGCTWRHSHEAIWLERYERGAWNKNWIVSCPDYFSPPRAKNSLGTRLLLRRAHGANFSGFRATIEVFNPVFGICSHCTTLEYRQ